MGRWPAVRRLGRWQQLLVDALAEDETVAVQTVVENHLGRRPSRSELTAAQRAAHLLARRGGATIGHVAVRSGIHRSRLAVSRPRQWPGDWLEQDDHAVDRSDLVQWAEPAPSAGTPPARFGRWQQVIMDALAQYELVGLRAVVEGHLGRHAERAEATAGQRAARLLAHSGQVRLAHVRVPAAKGRKGAVLHVVARAEVDPATMTIEEMQTIAIRHVASADRTREALDVMVDAVRQAAAQVAEVDLHSRRRRRSGGPGPRLATAAGHPTAPVTPDAPAPPVAKPACVASNVHSNLVTLKRCPSNPRSQTSDTSGSAALRSTRDW